MALRRSNRRITITGSSMFSASTPMVPVTIKENESIENRNGSPQWVSAEEALGDLKTPKFTKMTRRTTLTRQNIFDDETIIGGAALDNSGFKAPRFFIPVSPPGVKTRSRRSSIMVPLQPAKAKKVNKMTAGMKASSNIEKTDVTVTRRAASRRVSSVIPATDFVDQKPVKTKISSRRSVSNKAADGGDMDFANIEILSPIVNLVNKTDVKKARRSLKHQDVESEESVMSSESTALMHEFQTPRTHMSQGFEQRQMGDENPSRLRRSMTTVTPKAPTPSVTPGKSLSRFTKTVDKKSQLDSTNDSGDTVDKVINVPEPTGKEETTTLPKSALMQSSPTSVGVKRQLSKVENEEIEHVVKKMFSPSKLYSSKELNSKQKSMSPNSGKAASSPARTAILRDKVNTGRKSPARNVRDTSVTSKTPSRAAPKARKVLGVSTNSTPFNNNTQNRTRRSTKDVESLNVDGAGAVLSPSKSDDASFRENENDITLSHSSHSQWCTIL